MTRDQAERWLWKSKNYRNTLLKKNQEKIFRVFRPSIAIKETIQLKESKEKTNKGQEEKEICQRRIKKRRRNGDIRKKQRDKNSLQMEVAKKESKEFYR